MELMRIKKIMKEDVKMISAEAPVLFAKACEMFISELTLRSWNNTEENNRRTLKKNILLHFSFHGTSTTGWCQTLNHKDPWLPSKTVDDNLPVFIAWTSRRKIMLRF
ncbi:nuclear transcription factor Y subunit C-9-like protein [Trifolium pratense]|uniref:Nuclear transcription factor Y subunit C-9-like protein n=1 Tax=Trifolium pratense TaxID=57577 RepID=A0A2K3M8F9_TRIPR|nr:nuclear transcription factor Y subunit C-9-like protein [Trifolium pratense]